MSALPPNFPIEILRGIMREEAENVALSANTARFIREVAEKAILDKKSSLVGSLQVLALLGAFLGVPSAYLIGQGVAKQVVEEQVADFRLLTIDAISDAQYALREAESTLKELQSAQEQGVRDAEKLSEVLSGSERDWIELSRAKDMAEFAARSANEVAAAYDSLVVKTDGAGAKQISLAELSKEIVNESAFATAVAALQPPEKFCAPVGTLIASMLNPSQMVALLPKDGSLWVPADGRAVPGSTYAQVMGTTFVPDLRAVFLRGLNSFERNKPREDEHRDPNLDADRVDAGDVRADMLQEHGHAHLLGHGGNNLDGNISSVGSSYGKERSGYVTNVTGPTTGPETAPTHLLVYYYIRVN